VGDFDAALAGIEAALAAAKTAEHRHSALHAFRGYHEYRGAYQQALEYLERALAEAQTFQPPVAQVQIRLLTLDSYVRAGQPDAALQMLESLAAQLAAPPLNALVPLGRIAVYDALERPDDLSRAVAEGQEMLDRMGIKILEQHVIYGRGRMHELRGEWREAIAAYERERASDPTDVTIPAQLGRCHRELGELKRAEELIRETLAARPSDPRAHFELGLTYDRMKRRDDAVRHLRSALEAWAPADPSHKWAGQAREKLTQLGAPAA
jgi:tetratricopeptide (TPR) repeat protein